MQEDKFLAEAAEACHCCAASNCPSPMEILAMVRAMCLYRTFLVVSVLGLILRLTEMKEAPGKVNNIFSLKQLGMAQQPTAAFSEDTILNSFPMVRLRGSRCRGIAPSAVLLQTYPHISGTLSLSSERYSLCDKAIAWLVLQPHVMDFPLPFVGISLSSTETGIASQEKNHFRQD